MMDITRGSYYEFSGRTWVLAEDYRSAVSEINTMSLVNAELRSGIATTEALCFSHEGRIEKLMEENAMMRDLIRDISDPDSGYIDLDDPRKCDERLFSRIRAVIDA